MAHDAQHRPGNLALPAADVDDRDGTDLVVRELAVTQAAGIPRVGSQDLPAHPRELALIHVPWQLEGAPADVVVNDVDDQRAFRPERPARHAEVKKQGTQLAAQGFRLLPAQGMVELSEAQALLLETLQNTSRDRVLANRIGELTLAQETSQDGALFEDDLAALHVVEEERAAVPLQLVIAE